MLTLAALAAVGLAGWLFLKPDDGSASRGIEVTGTWEIKTFDDRRELGVLVDVSNHAGHAVQFEPALLDPLPDEQQDGGKESEETSEPNLVFIPSFGDDEERDEEAGQRQQRRNRTYRAQIAFGSEGSWSPKYAHAWKKLDEKGQPIERTIDSPGFWEVGPDEDLQLWVTARGRRTAGGSFISLDDPTPPPAARLRIANVSGDHALPEQVLNVPEEILDGWQPETEKSDESAKSLQHASTNDADQQNPSSTEPDDTAALVREMETFLDSADDRELGQAALEKAAELRRDDDGDLKRLATLALYRAGRDSIAAEATAIAGDANLAPKLRRLACWTLLLVGDQRAKQAALAQLRRQPDLFDTLTPRQLDGCATFRPGAAASLAVHFLGFGTERQMPWAVEVMASRNSQVDMREAKEVVAGDIRAGREKLISQLLATDEHSCWELAESAIRSGNQLQAEALDYAEFSDAALQSEPLVGQLLDHDGVRPRLLKEMWRRSGQAASLAIQTVLGESVLNRLRSMERQREQDRQAAAAMLRIWTPIQGRIRLNSIAIKRRWREFQQYVTSTAPFGPDEEYEKLATRLERLQDGQPRSLQAPLESLIKRIRVLRDMHKQCLRFAEYSKPVYRRSVDGEDEYTLTAEAAVELGKLKQEYQRVDSQLAASNRGVETVVGLLPDYPFTFALHPGYFPVGIGSTWMYESGSGERIVRISGRDVVDGTECLLLEESSGLQKFRKVFVASDEGITLLQHIGPRGRLDYEPRYRRFSFGTRAGDVWKYRGRLGTTSVEGTCTNQGRESIEIGGRRYRAFHVKEVLLPEGGRPQVTHYWLAKDVGIVRIARGAPKGETQAQRSPPVREAGNASVWNLKQFTPAR